jgi:dihydrofolate synthase/folylpolyglutamate synthase
VVTQTQQPAASNVIRENFHLANEGISEKNNKARLYEVSRDDLIYTAGLPRKMLGEFQVENAATAILAARIILQNDDAEEMIRTGIAQTVWKGRMELVNDHPFFMIDGAHNSHGVHALAESLKSLYPEEKFHFIMGVMADKDYEEMIEELLPLAMDFVTVTPESSRALQSKDLAECIQRKGVYARYADNMEEVVCPLLSQGISGETQGKTIAFGSLYFIGAIEKLIQEHKM